MGRRIGWGSAACALVLWSGLATGCSSNGSATNGRGGAGGIPTGGAGGTAAGGGSGGATPPPADAPAFCSALHDSEVNRLVACSAGQRAPLAATYGQAWRCDGIVQAVAMGTATYDPVQAAACLDWLAHLPCGHSLMQPYSAGPCELALVGQVADGGACTTLDVDLDLSECARTSWCDTSQTCPGVCRPNTNVGQPCDSSRPCERGTYCGALHAGDPRTCVPIGGPQQSCDATYSTTLRPAGAALPLVGSADPCVEGYHCDLTQSVCVAEAADDPCKRGETFCPNGVCAAELVGEDGGSGPALVRYVCRPVSGDGGACAQLGMASQEFPYCPPGSACTAQRSCVPQVGPGSACDPSGQTTNLCADGFRCGVSNTCEALPPLAGFTCTHDLPCGHPGERCCYCPTCRSIFTCGAGATCDPSQICVAS